MKVVIKTKDNYAKKIVSYCTPSEWLILNEALKLMHTNRKVNRDDQAKAGEILSIIPSIEEEIDNDSKH